MSPPLPVPSKAAIHALRGLALGTSCAIGVIVEDRRRRISTLRSAVSNKEKLKASRQYHRTVEYTDLPSEADNGLLFSAAATELQWHERTETLGGERPPIFLPGTTSSNEAAGGAEEDARARGLPGLNTNASNNREQQAEPSIRQAPPSNPPEPAEPSHGSQLRPIPIIPVRGAGGWASSPIKSTTQFAKPVDPASLSKNINEILSSHGEERLDHALAKFFTSPQTNHMLQHVGDAWLETSARLSKACQAQGRWADARRVLNRILEGGDIEESWYYAHNPISIIESYFPADPADATISEAALSEASRLLLVTFKSKPQTHALEVERIGRRLLEAALALHQFPVFHATYWRVISQQDEGSGFMGWAIERLSEYHDYKNVVKYFLLHFAKVKPSSTLFNKTVDRVVYAVEVMQGLKATQVFHACVRMSSGGGGGSLRTAWIMRLMQAHWNRHRDISKTEALFNEVKSLGLLERVARPQLIYRVMVELSIKADKITEANSYYDELIRLHPEMSSDIPLKGYFAVVKAKAGDWGGVLEDFKEMMPNRHLQQEEYKGAFVTVLKIFAQGHPAAEVRDFVTMFARDLHVGMHRYTITLVANKYGQCHDMAGFMSWLEYCNQAGFLLDPAFCNALLHNCRTQWKFCFEQLKRLATAMRQLNPAATDDTTERILSQASCAERISRPKPVRPKGVSVNKLAYVGRSTNRRDVYEAMNLEIGNGKPAAAVAIYKRAMRFGMPFCSHCLRLAVTAALEQPSKNGPGPALPLIRDAHEQGQDVTSAVSMFIRIQMDRFQAETHDDVAQHMQNLISRFETLHIEIDPAVLTHAAIVCIKLGQHGKAISLCHLAVERDGAANLCFSRQSFRALLMAYSQTLDMVGMRELLAALRGSAFGAEKKTLLALRSTLKGVQRCRQSPAARGVQAALADAIATTKQLRSARQAEGRAITQETLRIMGKALADFQSREAAEQEAKKRGGGGGRQQQPEPEPGRGDSVQCQEPPTPLGGAAGVPLVASEV